MKKSSKKILGCLMVATMLFSTAIFAGCSVTLVIPNIVIGGPNTNIDEGSVGGTTDQPTDEPSSKYKKPTKELSYWQDMSSDKLVNEDRDAKTVAYQFVVDGAEVGEQKRVYDIIMNLYDDGFASLVQYKTDGGYVTDYYGYWANMNDENIYLGFACHTNTTQPGTVCGVSYSYNLSETDGMFDTFGLNLALGFGEGGVFVRNYDVSGDGKVTYATLAEYEKHIGFTRPSTKPDNPPDEPVEAKVLFSFDTTSETSTLDIYDDGTYVFTFKTVGLVDQGTWEWKNWKFSLTDKGGNKTEAVLDEEKNLNLSYVEHTTSNGKVKREFTCSKSVWGTAFGGQGTYGEAEEAKVLFSFVSDSENYLLDIYNDGTYVFTFKTAGLVDQGTWKWENWKFSLTDKGGNVTEAVLDEEKNLTLTYVEHTMSNGRVTRAFSCSKSVWGTAFGGQGTYEQ